MKKSQWKFKVPLLNMYLVSGSWMRGRDESQKIQARILAKQFGIVRFLRKKIGRYEG